MADTWRVHTNTGMANVPFDRALLYADARQRVLASRRLVSHYDLLLGDSYGSDDDHLRWVIGGKVSEIEEWAKQIKEDSDG